MDLKSVVDELDKYRESLKSSLNVHVALQSASTSLHEAIRLLDLPPENEAEPSEPVSE